MSRPHTPEVIDHICRLYADGLPISAIAAEVGVSTSAVSKHAKQAGISRKDAADRAARAAVTPEVRASIFAMRGSGQTLASIAHAHGLHREQVRRICSTPEAQDEMYGLGRGRWALCPARRIQVWVPA